MSLAQLLLVGQSIQTIEDRPSRYKVRDKERLPTFGPVKHPEETTTEAMNTVAIEAPAATSTPPNLPVHAYPHGRWTLMKNPFVRKSGPPAAAKAVQGELSLDAVRVVRNDLNDSDLELVPANRKPAAGPEPAPSAPSNGLVWSRITARIFGRT